MKIYRYQAMPVSGNTDPYILFNRLYKEYQNIIDMRCKHLDKLNKKIK